MDILTPLAAPNLIRIDLDFHRQHSALVFSLHSPVQQLTARSMADVEPVLAAAEQAWRCGHIVAGFVAYGAAPAFDAALHAIHTPDIPLAWFGVFNALDSGPAEPVDTEPYDLGAWHADLSDAQYAAAYGTIQDHITRGNIYQANLTCRNQAAFTGSTRSLLRSMVDRLGSGYNARICLGTLHAVCASPELFFHWTDSHIKTSPMKGTRPRGRDLEDDAIQAGTLWASEKDRAENVMIVDLLRNDLGKIAVPGTVDATRLFDIERYRTVLQMTSTVVATVPETTSLTDIFRALFPCGSITGAPKVRAMQIIADTEQTARGVYCGTIGVLHPTLGATFNVAIRTATVDTAADALTFGVGSGIVHDSELAAEQAELQAKSQIMAIWEPELALVETLKLYHGCYALLQRHLDRLARSAAFLSIPVDWDAVVHVLNQEAEKRATYAMRVRLTVSVSGTIQITSAPLAAPVFDARFDLAQQPINSSDIWLYHKTTFRSVYQHARSAAPGGWDTLLWNERGEITEFTIGNVGVSLGGELVTPPVSCGLLPGTLREEMLARGLIAERIVTVADLARADQVWFLNSVRGLVPVSRCERTHTTGVR